MNILSKEQILIVNRRLSYTKSEKVLNGDKDMKIKKVDKKIAELPDNYLTEGIFINWKDALKYHRELNKLREKHGIRKT